jgi:hypothetical protein
MLNAFRINDEPKAHSLKMQSISNYKTNYFQGPNNIGFFNIELRIQNYINKSSSIAPKFNNAHSKIFI